MLYFRQKVLLSRATNENRTDVRMRTYQVFLRVNGRFDNSYLGCLKFFTIQTLFTLTAFCRVSNLSIFIGLDIYDHVYNFSTHSRKM